MNILEFTKSNFSKQQSIMEERHRQYGDNFKHFGKIAKELFPNGVDLNSEADWNRFGIVVQMISKLTRYAQNFTKGGHADSLDDLGNYALILQYLDKEEHK